MRSTFPIAILVALSLSSCASAQGTRPPQSAPPTPPAATAPSPSAGGGAADPTGTAPRVKLLATGGTISNRQGGRLSAKELIESIPTLTRYATPEFEQFANTASSSLTLQQWLDLARRITTLYKEDPALAGIVVTSGTDTLEELAFFLHLTVRDPRPVAVVGSMRNPSTLGYEGAANLLDGFRVAADPASRGRGVLVVLNDEINSAREVTKTDALRLQTFQTRGYGVLGVVDSDRVVYYRRLERRHTAESEFDPAAISELPRVDIILTYQGAPGDLIRAAVDAGAKGIVIATAGAGAMSGTQGEGVRYARGKGVAVVETTRTGSGRIANPPGSRGAFVGGEDLAPLKARILLMIALTTTQDPAQLRRIFVEY
jgi:L-asparaginase